MTKTQKIITVGGIIIDLFLSLKLGISVPCIKEASAAPYSCLIGNWIGRPTFFAMILAGLIFILDWIWVTKTHKGKYLFKRISGKAVILGLTFFLLGISYTYYAAPFLFGNFIQYAQEQKQLYTIPTDEITKVLPRGAFLREVDNLPGDNIKLVVYIENPEFDPNPGPIDLENMDTCPASTEGQTIGGVYHLALFQDNHLYDDLIIPSYFNQGEIIGGDNSNAIFKDNNLYNDILFDPFPFGLRYPTYSLVPKDMQMIDKTNIQKLAFKNTKENSYQHFGGDKYSEQEKHDLVVVNFIQIGEYTSDKNSIDFRITGPTLSCGHTIYLYGGYDLNKHLLKFYPLSENGQTYYWGMDLKPDLSGYATVDEACGDHGETIHSIRDYTFEATQSAYMLSSALKEQCQ